MRQSEKSNNRTSLIRFRQDIRNCVSLPSPTYQDEGWPCLRRRLEFPEVKRNEIKDSEWRTRLRHSGSQRIRASYSKTLKHCSHEKCFFGRWAICSRVPRNSYLSLYQSLTPPKKKHKINDIKNILTYHTKSLILQLTKADRRGLMRFCLDAPVWKIK